MASVTTIYCAGTGYDSKSGDIISWLNSHTSGTRGAELFFFPGPGSGEYADSLLTKQAADTARSVSRAVPRYLPAAKFVLDSAAATYDSANWVEKQFDAGTGDSLHARIKLAVARLRSGGAKGGVINLAGWSRGAVTCLGIAYALADDADLRTCKVNLFLFDPVPGPEGRLGLNSKNWAKELGTLRSNISDLSVVLMENEERDWMMAPLTQPFTDCGVAMCGEVPRSKISLYPMPGVHSSSVESGGNYAESADIGAHLVSEFLIEHGSPIQRNKLLNNLMLVETYARLKHKRSYGIIGGTSDRQKKIPNEYRPTLFYVNEHHREVFGRLFPKIAWILDARMMSRAWGPAASAEARMLQSHARTMAQVVGDGVSALVGAQCMVKPRDANDLSKLLAALGYGGRVAASFAPAVRSSAAVSYPARR